MRICIIGYLYMIELRHCIIECILLMTTSMRDLVVFLFLFISIATRCLRWISLKMNINLKLWYVWNYVIYCSLRFHTGVFQHHHEEEFNLLMRTWNMNTFRIILIDFNAYWFNIFIIFETICSIHYCLLFPFDKFHN